MKCAGKTGLIQRAVFGMTTENTPITTAITAMNQWMMTLENGANGAVKNAGIATITAFLKNGCWSA